MRRPGFAGRAVRRRAGAVVLACGLALLAGCGIRSTAVPTEFGAAPSRVPCTASAPEIAAHAAGELPVQVFLICGSQLVSVERSVEPADLTSPDDRVEVAGALLDELGRQLSQAEKTAGLTSDVSSGITVEGAREGDPAQALRLSTPPSRLTPFALAQVVCTLAHGLGPGTEAVVLGGPDPEAVLRSYACTEEVRARPGVVPVPTSSAN
ncbi:hypothetical protein [Streptomyces sp. KLOTTS4A1]|uniref:hypothetical protein n=1 Tax=Streptomyces sp. KLOTTS4A1 TaxID=3390996 RepID=UPI0039F6105D